MRVTVQIAENPSIRLTKEVEAQPPDRLAFTIEGVITMTEQVMDEFGGMTLSPTQIEITVDDSQTVAIDLTSGTSLRLSSADVGIETPDVNDLSQDVDVPRASVNDPSEVIGSEPAAFAFTLEGSLRGVPEETLEALSGDELSVATLTFVAEDAVRSDGGSGEDVILEIDLLGYGISVRRSGTISIGNRGTSTELNHL